MKSHNIFIVTYRGALNEMMTIMIMAMDIKDAIDRFLSERPDFIVEKIEYFGIVYE